MAAALQAEADWLLAAQGIACGIWGWPPEAFWNATPADMNAVLKGLQLARRSSGADGFDAADVAELHELMRKHEA